jgi:endoglucanase
LTQEDPKDLLRRLSVAAGPPGGEEEIRGVVRGLLDGVGPIEFDRLGSLICTVRGTADEPRVVLDCHLDEVAFMVQSVTADGNLAFVTLGNWWGHVLLGQRVEVLADGGRVPGVIGCKPPHFLSEDERKRVLPVETMYIDVGGSGPADVEKLGIRVGDQAVPCSEFRELAVDDVVSGKAFDNRVGVGVMCRALLALSEGGHPNTVIGVGAVQEEVGARGAATASALARPDVALVLECTPADDLPGQTARQAVLGGGPQIRHFDPTAISSRRLVRFVEETAAERGIEIQMAVRRSGGTDAKTIHTSGAGVPTVVIGVPARYIHSHVSLLHLQDYDAAARLVVELVGRLDRRRVDELTSFE